MGNINCTPADCVNMRPGQAAAECFKTPSNREQKTKVNSGTPQELLEEWNEVIQQVSNAFSDDPESNLFVLKLSKALLTHIFEKRKPQKTRSTTLAPPQLSTPQLSSHQGSQRRGKILQQILMSPATSSIKPRGGEPHQKQQPEVDQISIKELISLINAHTTYASSFLPFMVQAEPLDLIEANEVSKKQQTLAQLKAKYEFDLMHSMAVLYLADTSAVRRFDFQMPEQLRFSSFLLDKVQVSPGTTMELKARQLLNQIREFLHLNNKLVIGGMQLIENEFQLMFVQGCKEEKTPRQQNWPNMLAGELIHSLSLLPGVMKKDEYKDTHVLQCIIRMQGYTYGQQQVGVNKPSDFSKQVQFLVVLKENLFLPKRVDYLLQLQKDVSWQSTRINEKQVVNMMFNLAPKTFLLIMSQRRLKHGKQKHKAQVQQMVEILHRQDKTHRKERLKNNPDSQEGATTNVANCTDFASKSALDFSGSNPGNQSHTIDQLMFRSHQTGDARPETSYGKEQVITMLDEDLKSFAKVKSENIFDQFGIGNIISPEKQQDFQVEQEPRPLSLIQLEMLMSQEEEESKEPIDASHLNKYGKLKGDYLLDLTKGSSSQSRPVIFTLDTCQKIGKIQGVGYVHYDTELLQTQQTIIKSSLSLKEALSVAEICFNLNKLKYLGIEGNWKVYYEEGSLTKFIYLSAKKQFVFNCMYEVQFYKRWIEKGEIFGKEIIFEDRDEPQSIAVQVTRPAVYLDDLVRNVWQNRPSRCSEFHTELKVYYILFQILSQIKVLVVDKGLSHNMLRLRSFQINRLNWEIKLTNFAFAARLNLLANPLLQQQRGCISGTSDDQYALIALIEELSSLPGNEGGLRIAFCHYSDLIQSNYKQGIFTIIDNLKLKLVDGLGQMIKNFTEEDKLEQAFDFLLRQLGQNPMFLSPYSWLLMKTRNSIDDLKKASAQSRWVVSQRIVYDSATTKAQIIDFLTEVQDMINGAIQTIKPDSIEENKVDEEDEPIVMNFRELKTLKRQDYEKTDSIESMAEIGITLLYFFLEKLVNHATGGILEAVEILLKLQELFNYDYGSVYYHLIKTMMADVRLQLPQTSAIESNQVETHYNEVRSKLELARILILKDLRMDTASEILDDLYLGFHPLATLFADNNATLNPVSSALKTEQYIPSYFKQRIALFYHQNALSCSETLSLVLQPKLSGVSTAQMVNYDHVYLIFYNMQRLILLFIYHELILPDEIFPTAYMPAALAQNEKDRNTGLNKQKQKPLQHQTSTSSQDTSSTQSRRQDPPLYMQLQKFLKRLFQSSLEIQQSFQFAFSEFFETVLYLQMNEEAQKDYKKLFEVFCTLPAQVLAKTQNSGSERNSFQETQPTGSEDSSSQNEYSLNQNKFQRLEKILQLMRARIASFAGQLVIEQHDKFWRPEYYKAAYLNQAVPRYSDETDSMEPEDLRQEFLSYLAIVLQITPVDETQIQAFERSKVNFLRCPCCPSSLY